MKRFFLFSFLLLSPIAVQAAPSMQEMSLKVTEEFILPAYDDFAKQAHAQSELWGETCDAEKLKPAFQKTSDAWAKVQHINFGPITSLLRRDRLYHWPERRNSISKSINKSLADKDPASLDLDKFASTSVALQGLPALERLLYSDGLLDGDFACKLGHTIALNIEKIATGTDKDWQEALVNIKEGIAHPIYFESMDEVAIRFFTEMLAGFQMITDQKIALPLSSSLKKANGKRAEGWRSNRSTRYIQQNSLALMAMAKPFMSFMPDDVEKQVVAQFTVFARAANALPLSIKDGVKDEEGRAKIKKFLDETRTTRNLLVQTFTKHLGLTVGFNSLDGD
ncbi:MAG: imelysin family protein [Methylocystaceae bacterium]|nr:imelysin family protein [Methylocystaceae bacterium]